MFTIGALGFLSPYFLIGLAALPLIWLLLRATPPRPKIERFPGVRVLLGLDDRERTPKRTPWWLLLLRLLIATLLLFAFAEPVLNPKTRLAGDTPILVVMDGGWASAPDWSQRRAEALDLLAQAGEDDRPVAVVRLAESGPAPENLDFETAEAAAERVAALEPIAARPDPSRLLAALEADDAPLEIYWLHSGLASGDDQAAEAIGALAEALAARGELTLIGPETPTVALAPPAPDIDGLTVRVLRPAPGPAVTVEVAAYGRPPSAEARGAAGGFAAAERRLAGVAVEIAAGETEGSAVIALPVALANAVDRLEIAGFGHAGAVALLDDRNRRRVVALVDGVAESGELPLLTGAHYVTAALEPVAAVRETSLAAALGLADPSELTAGAAEAAISTGPNPEEEAPAPRSFADVIVLVDVARMDGETEQALLAWVESGGLLIRFAGPRLAALAAERAGFGRPAEDPLLPVPLRGGGRALGGALSWSEPQTLSAFDPDSPFAGIDVSDEVTVTRQVLAQPGPGLSELVWAALEDGTPLVTSRPLGAGRIVLFHTTAAPGWSSLPLSGVFVEMLDRMVASAPALSRGVAQLAEDDRVWRPARTLDGFGALVPAEEAPPPIPGDTLEAALAVGAAPEAPAGYYATQDEDGAERVLAVSAVGAETAIGPRPEAPAGAVERTIATTAETVLKAPLLAAALALFLFDALVAMALAGRLRGAGRRAASLACAALLGGALAATASPAAAQETVPAPPTNAEAADDAVIDPAAQRAALDSVLAYVITGDEEVDRASAGGLLGLSATLFARTAVEPGEPAGVNLETDDLAVYSLIYWPITADQPDLSDAAVRKLNAYIRTGGMLLVDTQDAHRTFSSGEGPNAEHLRRLIGRLDLPPLEPLPADHVATRTFYLIESAPGRWGDATVWVAAGGGGQLVTSRAQGEPTPLVNDGVSPIIIGSVDWAGAWAVDDFNAPLYPLGRGVSREDAYRFGVNVVIYAYTGNYKTDQVHIREVLDRVGGRSLEN